MCKIIVKTTGYQRPFGRNQAGITEALHGGEGGEPPRPRWTRRLTEKMKTKSLPGRKGSLHLTYWFIRNFFLCEPIRPALIFCYQLIVSYEPFRPAYFFYFHFFYFFISTFQ